VTATAINTMFGIDSSSHFHVRAQTNRQAETTERPTHADGYAGVGNKWHANITESQVKIPEY